MGHPDISEAASDIPEDDPAVVRGHDLIERLQAALGSRIDEPGAVEAFLEKEGKPKRGRPRTTLGTWGFGGSDAKTRRGRQNSEYAYTAAACLFEHRHAHHEVLELTGHRLPNESFPDGCPDSSKWKAGILAELGRIISRYSNGEEIAVDMAVKLAQCRPRLTVKQAIAWIRKYRLAQIGVEPRTGSIEELVDAVCKVVDDYLSRHPGAPINLATEALNEAYAIYQEVEEQRAGPSAI